MPYWLFIISSCGIATLGLIINSPAVIIGAMLVSPLMSPIIGLGMGIAINDVYLGFKSVVVILLSFLAAALTSAIISFIVPFHEPTTEIISRTNPTLLDLFVALFCGLVAALSSVRSRGESAMKDVAPGAAIGVALMPPICVVGFGLGTGFKLEMMWGAFLLFLTNLMAIILVTSLVYYFVYHSYDYTKLTRLLSEARSENDVLFRSRIRLLWRLSSGEKTTFRRRFWFPGILLLMISYPLLTSFQFLKTKIDVRNYIGNYLAQNVPDILILRGPESLHYSRQGVNGNIIYSSGKSPAADIEKQLTSELTNRYNNYQVKLALVRIAGSQDIDALKIKKELNLETSPTTLHDRVRHAYAIDLVRRAHNLLHNRFPIEVGLVLDVKIKFGEGGMDTVDINYVGKPISAETKRVLEMTLRNELHELKGEINRVVIKRASSDRGTIWCSTGKQTAIARTEVKLNELLKPLQYNSDITLKLSGHSFYQKFINQAIETNSLTNVSFLSEKQSGCAIKFSYHNSATQ